MRVTLAHRIAVIAAAGLLTVGTASGATANGSIERVSYEEAVPGVAPSFAVAAEAVYYDQAGNVIDAADAAAPEQGAPEAGVAAVGCTPGSGRDNPHFSSGDVSGHGWWTKGTCTADTARVYNCLYEWYTDNSWRQKACAQRQTLTPGGGRGNRTTARATCDTREVTSWRNHVDVDVNGQIDTGEQPYNQSEPACRVH